MTNFEKWKQDLTSEEFAEKYFSPLECEFCPALDFCRITDENLTCDDTIIKWANTEVQE